MSEIEQGGSVIEAFVFDMDGVVTNTAEAHFAAWKEVFDDFLKHRADGDFKPFSRADYLSHVDGIPRYDGVRGFLRSRGVDLPEGDEDDEGETTVRGLGNRKNKHFHAWLERNRVPVFDDTRQLIDVLRRNGVKVGIFSASRNAKRVLESAGVRDLFDAAIDGADADDLGLAPKPEADMLVETARRLGCAPANAAVVEDAVSGVEAGSNGRFALVVGVNRQQENPRRQAHALRAHGADLVVPDLQRLLIDGQSLRTMDRLPNVWDHAAELRDRLGDRVALFLDYDGTLTPIVEDYRKADISDEMVQEIRRTAERHPTAIISGRDLDDVRSRVGLEQVFYAGSHGFDIAGPGGVHDRPEQAESFLPPMDAAEKELADPVARIPGAEIERKTFSIALHFRKVADEDVETLEQAVDDVVERHSKLRKGRGKKVFEIQPRAEWDKGRAVQWLLDNTRLGEDHAMPLYIGDDLTDEDAFGALAGRGVSIVVRGGDRVTTADYALADPDDVGRFLGWLCEPAEVAR